MSETTGEKLRYRVNKMCGELEELSIEEHGTIVNMLSQNLEFRILEYRKAKEDEQEAARQAEVEVKAAADREGKFSPFAGSPFAVHRG